VNNDEQRLADVLHRITPEPPRPVTVEQVAYRLVSEPRLGRQPRGRQAPGREPRPRRGGLGLSRAWVPALAAAAVVVIAGASAGIAVLANSHQNSPSPAGGAPASSAVSSASASASPSPSQTSSSTQQTTPATRIAGGPWGAELINHQTFNQGSLVSANGSLYTFGTGTLDRIDPATGDIVATAQANPPLPNPPVIIGNTVWVLWSYSGGNVVLHAFDARTLAPIKQVLVPAVGAVDPAGGSNVVTSGPDGHLYVAAGIAVVIVNPENGQVLNRINLTAGTTNSVAISPDGSRIYVGVGGFRVLVYALPSDTVISSSKLTGTDSGGDLVATSGGVWGTTGTGMSEWTWFAPDGDLTRAVRIGAGAGGGFASLPSYSDGVVWVGGSHTLSCANPANGHVLRTVTLPTDHSVIEYFSSPVISGGRAYSYYTDDHSQLSGLVRMTPPAACTGNVSS
jgi:sugar lactone lactonase YvrE